MAQIVAEKITMSNKFEYNYSAPTEEERREIESIKNEYLPKTKGAEKSGVERLRALDNKAKNPPLVCSLSLGIIGILLFGFGLTCWLEWTLYIAGVITGVIGAVIVGINPFIYKAFLARRRKKYSAEILALSSELLNEEQNDSK